MSLMLRCPRRDCGESVEVDEGQTGQFIECLVCGTGFQVPSTNVSDDERMLGDYRLIRKLGEGGMGEVWEAIQKRLERTVALKILSSRLSIDPTFVSRFQREARTAAALNHPNIIQIFDVGIADDQHVMALEFVDGGSLEDLLKRKGKLELLATLELTRDLAQALNYAKDRGVYHRDIKPDNILLTSEGKLKIADLGLAKLKDDLALVTQSNIGLGTPHFMAPEQAENAKDVDHRADIYSLGIMLLRLLTGRYPFHGSSYSIIMAHATQPLPSSLDLGTEVPKDVEELIQDMCAKTRDERLSDYQELTGRLNTLIEIHKAMAMTPATLPQFEMPRSSATGKVDEVITNPSVCPVQVVFRVTGGPNLGKEFRFSGHENFVVGRADDAHFRLPAADPYFSRYHLLVEVNPPYCRMNDMNSRNGTLLNGKKVSSSALQNGDIIRGGKTTLEVSLEGLGTQELAAVGSDETIRLKNTEESTSGIENEDLPDQIGKFKILRLIGRGGMGTVYLARNEQTGEELALKCILPALLINETETGRFLREAEILQQLSHSRIVRFREMGQTEDKLLYIAMDFVNGDNLQEFMKKREEPLPPRQAVGIAVQLLQALEYAHSRKFVHRDIKPSNVILSTKGKRGIATLTDFGLARVYQASQISGLTLEGDIAGSGAFMPPEQITDFRNVGPPGDIYAVGATLYFLLTKQSTYDFSTKIEEQLHLILTASPTPIQERRPDLPSELCVLIHKALNRKPDDRFATASVMGNELSALRL